MNKEDILAEKYAILNGWEKVDGVKLELTDAESDWDYVYFSKEELKSRAPNCTFWQYTEEEEIVHEDVWDVVEYIEDNMEVPGFEDYKKSEKKAKVSPSQKTGDSK